MNTFQSFLREIGLDSKESSVYCFLIKVGEAPASVIAKSLSLKRTSVYSLAEKLLNKSLLKSITKNGLQFYAAVEPTEFLQSYHLKQKKLLNRIDQIDKELKESVFTGSFFKSQPKANLMIGTEGIKMTLKDLLNEGKPLKAIVTYDLHCFIAREMPDLLIKRKQKGIPAKVVYTFCHDQIILKYDWPKEIHEVKCRPDTQALRQMDVIVYGEKTALVFLKEKFGVIVESRIMRENFERFFEQLWTQIGDGNRCCNSY